MPGYLPALSEKADESVLAAAEIAAQTSEKDYQIVQEDTHAYSGGSTDVGDVQHLQPVLTFNTGGKVSGLHSVDFDIVDDELAYVVTAKIFAPLRLPPASGRGCESKRDCSELSAHLYQRGIYQIYGFLY